MILFRLVGLEKHAAGSGQFSKTAPPVKRVRVMLSVPAGPMPKAELEDFTARLTAANPGIALDVLQVVGTGAQERVLRAPATAGPASAAVGQGKRPSPAVAQAKGKSRNRLEDEILRLERRRDALKAQVAGAKGGAP